MANTHHVMWFKGYKSRTHCYKSDCARIDRAFPVSPAVIVSRKQIGKTLIFLGNQDEMSVDDF